MLHKFRCFSRFCYRWRLSLEASFPAVRGMHISDRQWWGTDNVGRISERAKPNHAMNARTPFYNGDSVIEKYLPQSTKTATTPERVKMNNCNWFIARMYVTDDHCCKIMPEQQNHGCVCKCCVCVCVRVSMFCSLCRTRLDVAVLLPLCRFKVRVTEVSRNSRLGNVINTLPEDVTPAWQVHIHRSKVQRPCVLSQPLTACWIRTSQWYQAYKIFFIARNRS